MNTNRTCGCKSFRTCFVCEKEHGLAPVETASHRLDSAEKVYDYCPETGLLSSSTGEDCDPALPSSFPGIRILKDFVSADEEAALVAGLDALPWDVSQSGRRKQNFGPRANFNRRKAKVGPFAGFPACSRFVQSRFSSVSCLAGYRTVEQCSIEYRPETGAGIEPHVDDCWIWGERIVQLNLLSDAVLTCFPLAEDSDKTNANTGKVKYNLQDVAEYPRVLEDDATVAFNPFRDPRWPDGDRSFRAASPPPGLAVRIPLPRRSLLVMFGSARYDWEHSILRRDIVSRRVVVAYRELTPTFLPGGGQEKLGEEILRQAEIFW